MADIYTTLKVKTENGYDNIYPQNNTTIAYTQRITVPTSAWERNVPTTTPIAPNYPYRAKIVVPKMTTDYIPTVSFSRESLDLNVLMPITMSVDGGVEIYAESIPDVSVIVESVMGIKEIKEA